jgi:hypothetical protein
MKRIAVALVLVVAAIGAGSAGATRYFYGYSAPGEWFSPGEGYGSVYDHFCGPWVNNTFSKAQSAWGLITFIDTGGGWNNSVQGGGVLSRDLSVSYSRGWTKKLHCKNNRTVGYQGGCFGIRDSDPNCV